MNIHIIYICLKFFYLEIRSNEVIEFGNNNNNKRFGIKNFIKSELLRNKNNIIIGINIYLYKKNRKR